MREIQTRAPHFCLAGCVQFGGNLTRRVGFLSNRRRLVADVVRGGDAIEWNSTATRHKTCFAGWIRPQTELHPRWHPTLASLTLASLLTNQRGGGTIHLRADAHAKHSSPTRRSKMNEPAKKPWQRPELIVLVRSNPEEAVLTSCKIGTLGLSSSHNAGNCASIPSLGCQVCSDQVAS